MTRTRWMVAGALAVAAILGITNIPRAQESSVAFAPAAQQPSGDSDGADEKHPADESNEAGKNQSDGRAELIARLDAALAHYERAGEAATQDNPPSDVELPAIGDGASIFLAALRAYVSGETDPTYGKTWEQWKTRLSVETIGDLARQAADYAAHDEWFRDLPTHVEARKLLRDGFQAVVRGEHGAPEDRPSPGDEPAAEQPTAEQPASEDPAVEQEPSPSSGDEPASDNSDEETTQ